MNRLKYSLIAIFAFGSLAVFGQKSTGAAQFPELTPDVRGVGMGNSGVAATANAFSIYRNAAKSIFSTQKAEIGYSFTPWLRELSKGSNLHGVAGYWNLDEKQGITAGFRWFNHSETNIWDKEGNDAGTFTPKNWSVDVGYARKLTDDLSVGATARFIRSDMSGLDKDDVANAVAFDLGLYYRRNFENWEQSQWAVGLQASNFGTKIDYGYGKYDQASKVAAGYDRPRIYRQTPSARNLGCGLPGVTQYQLGRKCRSGIHSFADCSDSWRLSLRRTGQQTATLRHVGMRCRLSPHQSRLCLFDSGEGQSFKEYMAGGIKHRFGII